MVLNYFTRTCVCNHYYSACVLQSVRLSRLDVCNVPVVDYPAQSLSKALLTSRLTVLHLHNAQLSGMPLYTLGMVYKHTHALTCTHTHTHTQQDCLFVRSFSCVDCEYKCVSTCVCVCVCVSCGQQDQILTCDPLCRSGPGLEA